jgi:hypothetical protein
VGVELAGRLVDEQQAGRGGDAHRERGPLAGARRQVVDLRARPAPEADQVEDPLRVVELDAGGVRRAARWASQTLRCSVAYGKRLRAAPCSTTPISVPRSREISASVSLPRSYVPTLTRPADGRISPPSNATSVDLPEPDGPTSASISPGLIDRSTPESATTSPPSAR